MTKRHPLWRACLAELLGTGMLTLAVVGSGIAAARLSSDAGIQLGINAAATGLALFVIITVFGPASGAHLNPVVSLVDAALGGRPWKHLAGYVPAQFVGAMETMFGGFRERAQHTYDLLKDPGTAFNDPLLGHDPQPKHMNKYVHTFEDNGGVHINSGIPNHAFYQVATRIGGHAWEKAGRVWYETVRDKRLRKTATFAQFARLTLDNGDRWFGADVRKAVAAAWDEVGVKVR